MDALVSLMEAKTHLHVLDNDSDDDIALKALMATDIVIDYIERPDNGWSGVTAPPLIKAAILLVLRCLYDDSQADPLDDAVMRVLRRYRDPVLA